MALPTSLHVERDHASEAELLEQARKFVASERGRDEPIHASDLIYPRKAYWQRVDPRPNTARDTLIFFVGRILHAFIIHSDVANIEQVLGEMDEGSRRDEDLGITWSPDMFRDGVPHEVKTDRKLYPAEYKKTGEIRIGEIEDYLKQLLIYMAASRSTSGKLKILHINLKDENNRTAPAFRCYTITVSEADIERLREGIKKQRALIEDALRRRSDVTLAGCPFWMRNETMCKWYHKCSCNPANNSSCHSSFIQDADAV